MRVGIAVGVGLLCLTCVGAVAADQPPLASAGLDQEARANTTVYLDAGGSVDPDGSIEQYEWIIETPDGNTTTPDCATCAKTSFVPEQTGQYNATVQVRGADGLSRSDTLYVTVSAPLALPSAPSGGGGVGTGGGGFGGGGGGLGSWNAIVNNGDELVLSTARGSDFVLDTPLGQVTIGPSALERAREPDGDLPYENVKDYFQAVGLSKEIIRDVASRSLSEGGTCKSSQGDCTTSIPDDEELTEEARRNMGLYSEYESESSSDSNEVSEISTQEPIEGSISSLTSAVGSFISGGDSDNSNNSNDNTDRSTSNDPISNVVDHVTGSSDPGHSDSGSNDGGGDSTSSYDDGFGSPVP